MTLLERINEDLVASMKSKDAKSLNVIRMLKGAIQLEKINKKADLTDDEVIAVVSKQIKMRNDSIIEFEKGNRKDLVDQNKEEIAILNKYLPAQLTEEEVIAIIDEAFAKVNPTSSKEMGLIMKEVTPKLRGKTDMSKASEIIKNKLANI